MKRFAKGMSNGGSVGALNANGLRTLSDDELMTHVPSIFATESHESRSDRFGYVSTFQMIEALRDEGFQPFFAQQINTRKEDRRGFTKHMVRLRHESWAEANADEAHDICLQNGNDGSSAWQMFSGIWRFMCCNGLYTGDTFASIKVPHRGDAMTKVIEGAYTVLEDGERIKGVIDDWKSIQLPDEAQRLFAEGALRIRYDNDLEKAPVGPVEINHARRWGDEGRDLWRTFNRCQENVIRGGLRGQVRGKDGKPRNKTIRAVNGLDQKKAMNEALFGLATQIADMVK